MIAERLFEFVVLSSLICGIAGMLVLGSKLISEPPAPRAAVASVTATTMGSLPASNVGLP